MKEEKTTPLRQRMIEDMNIRGLCEKTQQGHLRFFFSVTCGREEMKRTCSSIGSRGSCRWC